MTDVRIAGIVLAGGQSRRMGGGQKFLLELGATSVLGHVLARLRPQVEAIAISANCDPALLAEHRLPVLADAEPSRGPLSGLLAGLEWAARGGATHIASVPADTPFLPLDLLARLRHVAGQADTIAIASSRGRRHPVAGLWPVSVAPALRRFLDTSERWSVMEFVTGNAWESVEFPVEGGFDPFFNINQPADLERARHHLGQLR